MITEQNIKDLLDGKILQEGGNEKSFIKIINDKVYSSDISQGPDNEWVVVNAWYLNRNWHVYEPKTVEQELIEAVQFFDFEFINNLKRFGGIDIEKMPKYKDACARLISACSVFAQKYGGGK